MVNCGERSTAMNGICTDPSQMVNACVPVESLDGWEELEKGMKMIYERMGWLIQQASAIESHLLPEIPAQPVSPPEEAFGLIARLRRGQQIIIDQQARLETILTRIGQGRA